VKATLSEYYLVSDLYYYVVLYYVILLLLYYIMLFSDVLDLPLVALLYYDPIFRPFSFTFSDPF
jgi:hypothetical protein